jgi:hypothetical protein
MKRTSLFAVTCAALALSLTASAEDGKAIFNGKDLTGWEGNMVLWSVKDGCIHGQTTPENPLTHNTFLVWRAGKVGDFELTCQYRITSQNDKGFGNSGIQYRSHELPRGEMGPIISGYQADFEFGTTYSGILYEEKGRGILAKRGEKTLIKEVAKNDSDPKSKDFAVVVTGSVGDSAEIQAGIKQGEWNTYKIVAKGNHVQHFINGKQTIDVTDEDAAHAPKEGLLALQIHVGGPMTVDFKDLLLKELK